MYNRKNNKLAPWPLVDPKDNGIRPAGKAGECFYCNRKVGEEHKRDCVTIQKKVRVQFTVEVIAEAPHSWPDEMIADHQNELWTEGCTELIAPWGGSEFVVVVCEEVETVDDTPTRKVQPLLSALNTRPELN